jgi:hypothetical protein
MNVDNGAEREGQLKEQAETGKEKQMKNNVHHVTW